MFGLVFIIAVIFFFAIKWRCDKMTIRYYHGRHVLITGCDSGFGYMLALRLDSLGYTVYAGCLTENGANELKQRGSDNLQVILLDVTCSESIEQAHQYVKANLPGDEGTVFLSLRYVYI